MSDDRLKSSEAILMFELYATAHWRRRSVLIYKTGDQRRDALRAALIDQDLADKPAFERIPTWSELFERVYDVPLKLRSFRVKTDREGPM